jgi:hypothetical protein
VGTVSHFNSADGAQLPSYLEMLLPPATARCHQCKLLTSFHLHRLHHSGDLEERAGGRGMGRRGGSRLRQLECLSGAGRLCVPIQLLQPVSREYLAPAASSGLTKLNVMRVVGI